ncbi:KAT8 regulatory NSL complex subunit 1-like protein [Araneus ventricosus]|uniref:KAT8 regulatory NSL complex subunit 1-like protein n=1 Tax=Araneus ventricosus TaxID=182803 RepID=A0A4Y2JZW8_ARAVE|nr:KAT8 regulatory NSL complex subunit 1-like protein [Araneus ventricosus]
MLSPASLRVCCLAVMAPALTKADRRADCLPVVLPFCMSKTADSENRKDRINELSLAKLPNKFASLLNKRKHLMNKAWFRTYIRNNSELSDRNRYSQFDLRKSLLNSKVRLNAETKIKSWHGTNVTLAVADKVRLKYTMNKNNNSLRNMGLARANTSLGLHSMKKMNRSAQLTQRDKGSPSNLTQESSELTPDLPDSTNLELETPFRIVRVVRPVPGQSTGDVSCSGDLTCDSALSAVENMPVCTTGNSSSNQDVNILSISNDSNTPPLSVSPNDTEVSLSETNLSVTLTDSKCSLNETGSLDTGVTKTFVPVSNSNKLSSKSDATSVKGVELNDNSVIQESSVKLSQHLNQNLVPDVLDKKESELRDSSADHLNCVTPLPSPVCSVPVQDDTVDIAASLEDKAPFSPCSPSRLSLDGSDDESGSCTSSTLSADDSPLPSSLDDGNEKVFITFPDSFLASASGAHKELTAPAFLDASCFTFNSLDSVVSDDGMHIKHKACCPLPEKDQSLFSELLLEHHEKITVALKETEFLLRKYMMQHVQEQIRTFVQHFQKKLNIPCQRQTKSSGSKSTRDLVDLKAELLQSENVKNLSTAALVNLVRNIGSNASSGNILPLQNATSQDSELPRNKLTSQTFASEDFVDVKHTSKVLLKNMKNLLRSADPDLTESSDEGSSDVEMDDPAETPVQKKALWKFVKERAALASRSTLLISKIRELENQLQTISGCAKNVNSSYEKPSFEDQLVSENADDTSLQATLKLGRPKGLGRPVNGYLDHSSVSSTIHVGTAANNSGALLVEQKHSNSVTVDASESCMRARPLNTSNFQKRKLVVTTGLHLTNPKLAKLSTVSCVCNSQEEMLPCVLCTGRYNCIQSVDPDSLPLLDRVALLDPSFHPLLSFEKDIPLLVHFENILKKNEAQYQTVRPISPTPSHRSFGTRPMTDAKSRSRKLKRYARSLLSAKYHDKKKHFRKHKLVFGKWRKLQSKSSFHARNRFRRFSVASSGSSHDSPVPSPLSAFDDGSGYDARRRRDDNQFDIDDVIIPYSNKRGRLVKFEFKDIEIPSWRSVAFEDLKSIEMEEDTSDAVYIKRHEGYEIEERKIIRNGGGALGFFNTWQKRARRQHRSDSRADSSGANTPDPVLMCDQDILFQDTNSMNASSPLSPALSPPATPSSANVISDDSQTAMGNMKKKVGGLKRQDELSIFRASTADYDEISPYERRTFPLSDETIEDLLAEADHNRDDTDVTASGPSCPASPASTTSSTSTVEEEDITDPEWRVVRRESGPEQALVLKFAKR